MRSAIAAVALLGLVGCKKSQPTEPTEPEPSGPGYTIRFPNRTVGQKERLTVDETETTTVRADGKTEQSESRERFQCIEHVLELTGGKPTRPTRAYQYAQAAENGQPLHDLPYSGKLVAIEKKNDIYAFSVDGRQLTPIEAKRLISEFDNPDNSIRDRVFPKTPVRVNEKWQVDNSVVSEMMRGGSGVDAEKSTITIKFTRAYTGVDGKTWGVFKGTMNLAVKNASPQAGTTIDKVIGEFTGEFPLDGSSRNRTITFLTATVGSVTEQGKRTQVESEARRTETRQSE